jgi:RimJ/RimL family protein N-acetyltransferase
MRLPTASRLTFREMTDADLDDMAALLGDEDVMRFYPGPMTRSEARDWIARNQRRYRDHGFGLWIINVRDSMQGQGYATEAAAASRDFARDVLGAGRLIAIINPLNVPSRRVAAKIGLKAEKRAVAPNGTEAVIYATDL